MQIFLIFAVFFVPLWADRKSDKAKSKASKYGAGYVGKK